MKWTCTRCTLDNEAAAVFYCGACGEKNPKRMHPPLLCHAKGTKRVQEKKSLSSRSIESSTMLCKSASSAKSHAIPFVAALGDKVQIALNQFGHTSFRYPQEAVVKALMKGQDCFVLMPTGGGKSLCFQLPAVLHEGVTLVVSPLLGKLALTLTLILTLTPTLTLALMADQVAHLNNINVKVAAIHSQQTVKENQAIKQALGLVPPPFKIVYVTPETLTSSDFSAILSRLQKHQLLSMIAIDEAHCISSWGHDFRPAYRRLGDLRKRFPNVPIIALTATATMHVRNDIKKQLQLHKCEEFVSSFDRPNIFYEVWALYFSEGVSWVKGRTYSLQN
jgi:RecQ family ATP-dependent DNA helicase